MRTITIKLAIQQRQQLLAFVYLTYFCHWLLQVRLGPNGLQRRAVGDLWSSFLAV